jgi:hypothetical protein
MQYLILGVLVYLIAVAKPVGANLSGTAQTTRAVRAVPASIGGKAVGSVTATGILGYAQSAYKYIKQLYDTYKGVSAVTSVTTDTSAAIGLSPSEFAASQAGNVAAGIDDTVNAGLAPTGSLIPEVSDVPTASVAATGAAAAESVTGAGSVGVGLTGVGTGIYAGTSVVAGTEVATVAGASVLGTAAIGGAWLAVGFIVEELINLGLNDYKTGQISKEIMRRKQIAIMQQGAARIEEAIAAAATFGDAVGILAHAPSFTSGQVQFGIGTEYAGMHLAPGVAGTTETDKWSSIIVVMSDPVTLKQHPEAIVNFIANLWVQTGPGGATAFDQQNTFLFRLNLLTKLPYTPEWNYIKTIILNMEVVDPRDIVARDAAIDAVAIPPEDNFIRLGWARVPTDRNYMFYDLNATPPVSRRTSAELIAYGLAAVLPDQPWIPLTPSPYYYDQSGQIVLSGQSDPNFAPTGA